MSENVSHETPSMEIFQTIKAENGFPARFEFRFAYKTDSPAKMPSVYISARTMAEAIINFKEFIDYVRNEHKIWDNL